MSPPRLAILLAIACGCTLSLSEELPQKISPEFLEISAHGTQKVTARVLWRLSNSEALSAHDLAKPFSFEWVKPPQHADAFVIQTHGVEAIEKNSQAWIPLARDGTPERRFNLYVSLRGTAGGEVNANFNKETEARDTSSLREVPNPVAGTTAWVYVGQWSEEKKAWGTMYWVVAEKIDNPVDRKPIGAAPSALKGTSVASDFPHYMRSGPSARFPTLSSDILFRPGSKAVVKDVSIDASGLLYNVWAQITISGPN